MTSQDPKFSLSFKQEKVSRETWGFSKVGRMTSLLPLISPQIKHRTFLEQVKDKDLKI
jgi:hypothetical protein